MTRLLLQSPKLGVSLTLKETIIPLLMPITESWQIIVRPLKSLIVFLYTTAKSLSINPNYVNVFSLISLY